MNILKSLSISIGLSFIFALPAFADQCAYIDKEIALSAATKLNLGQTIYKLCEPCGERQPEPVTISSLAAETVDYENYWQISVNGEGIDLAYTFVESEDRGQAENLAGIVGCPARGVSDSITVE
jgi:hypothetical protein